LEQHGGYDDTDDDAEEAEDGDDAEWEPKEEQQPQLQLQVDTAISSGRREPFRFDPCCEDGENDFQDGSTVCRFLQQGFRKA
jgi:hypothetical protein